MSNNEKVKNMVTRARTSIILDFVFFATLILRLTCVEDETERTTSTDGKKIYYSPNFFSKLMVKEVKAVMAHEILHCVFGHHTRRGNRDFKIWNRACDLAINPLLIEYGFELPSGALIEPSLKGLCAEEIYNLIMRDSNGLGKYKNESMGEDCGGLGTVKDAADDEGNPASEIEKSHQETEWKIAATKAANFATKAGNLPAGIKRLVEEHISPKLPWEDILYRFIDTNSFNDFSWVPPSRRHMSAGFYFPSVRSKELSNLYFGCDASGSVRNVELGMIHSSLNYIVDCFRCSTKVMWFDTKVHNVQDFDYGEIIKLEPKGGGGTDFKAPFKYMEDKGIIPNVLLMFTDMECSSYPPIPNFPVLWITWKKNYQKPPFGEVIVM